MWTIRLLFELSEWDSASFITLTYNDENLPLNGSLVPEDSTKFWKRLRKNLYNEYGHNVKLKYYLCGEYGTKTQRPHMHAIVFGLDCYSDKDRQILADSWTKCEPWFFDKSRGKYSAMLPVCREDIEYVTGYVQKKLNGELGRQEYAEKGRVPPFSRVSHGMGLDFAIDNKERLLDNGFTYLNGHKVSIPRYFCEKFDVKKSDLISIDSKIDLKKLEESNKKLFEQFKADMIKRNTWYPENLKMMSIRFERWYTDFQWTYAKRIEKDFLQRQKLKGVKI